MIYVEDQLIKVSGVVLPGLVKSIEVKESAKIDEQEVEGSAMKPKQATGYEDAKITVELILDDTPARTKYQALETVRTIFRRPGQTVPQPIPIVSEDTAKHGIDKVLFKGFSHKAEAKKEQITVSLEFWEYIPQTIKATKAVKASGSRGGVSNDQNGSGSSTTSGSLTEDYTGYLGTSRGASPVAQDVLSGVASSAASVIEKVSALVKMHPG